jgi:hypothetical protein
MNSGVATVSREIVLGTAHKYDWVQIAGAMQHPEAGKIADLSQATDQMTGTKGSYVKLYAVNGYGDENGKTQCDNAFHGSTFLGLVVYARTAAPKDHSNYLFEYLG